MARDFRSLVDVLGVDPEFADALGVPASGGARPLAKTIALRRGSWDGAVDRAALGLLVLSGFLVRRVDLAGRHSVELLGPGDLLRPFEVAGDEYAMVPSQASWRVLEPAVLAVLDQRFSRWICQRPQLLDLLLSRLLWRTRTLALRLALVQLPRLSARLHFLLWHLADRFGQVQRDGVLLPVPLPHALLADLVSAQRPSVSRAMKQLERHGLVSAQKGGWHLSGRPPLLQELAGAAERPVNGNPGYRSGRGL